MFINKDKEYSVEEDKKLTWVAKHANNMCMSRLAENMA